MNEPRALRADEIEVRIDQVLEKGVTLLLYKDARCDKRILDETFGIDGWANAYSEIKGNLYCSIMLHDKETGMWIQKQDCGTETYADKEKGEASDAFKRAGVNVGIGRELYTKIFIFVQVPTKQVGTKSNGKPKYELAAQPWDNTVKWHVKDIYTNVETKKIEYLQIANGNDVVVFTWGTKPTKKQIEAQAKQKQEQSNLITKEQAKNLVKIANGNNEVAVRVLERYGYKKSSEIKAEDYDKICLEIESEVLM